MRGHERDRAMTLIDCTESHFLTQPTQFICTPLYSTVMLQSSIMTRDSNHGVSQCSFKAGVSETAALFHH